MATSKQVLAAARKRWGKNAFIRENRRGLTKEQRDERRDLVKSMNNRIRELDSELKGFAAASLKLLESAEFFLSVNGDEPSGEQFRAAVAKSRHFQDCREEREALSAERDRIHGGCHSHRWDAGYIGTIEGIGQYSSTHAHGDTLDELLTAIRGNEVSEETAVTTS